VEEKCFFVLGFAKNNKANLTTTELTGLKAFAKESLNYDDERIKTALSNGSFLKIFCKDTV
jgi:hypothetical protein